MMEIIKIRSRIEKLYNNLCEDCKEKFRKKEKGYCEDCESKNKELVNEIMELKNK